MKDYAEAVRRAGIGGTPQLCQDALVELMEELFKGKRFIGQEGRKELKVFKQDLPIPKHRRDREADTDVAAAPYIVVEMSEGAIPDEDSPQLVEFSLIICAYDRGTDLEAIQDVTNIKEDIVQRTCSRPYFGGAFTIIKPIAWAMQRDRTPPYYFGAVTFSCTAPALTQDMEMEALV